MSGTGVLLCTAAMPNTTRLCVGDQIGDGWNTERTPRVVTKVFAGGFEYAYVGWRTFAMDWESFNRLITKGDWWVRRQYPEQLRVPEGM